MPPDSATMEKIGQVAGRIIEPPVRELFARFCGEILLLPARIDIEVAPFEVRFSAPDGFKVTVSPYRELFLVKVGSHRSCDIRVDGQSSLVSALDLAMRHALESRGRRVEDDCRSAQDDAGADSKKNIPE